MPLSPYHCNTATCIFFFFLQETLQPTSLDIKNDSSKHAGHTGNPTGAPDAETHFTSVRGCDGGFGTSGALRAGVAVCCGAGWLRCAEGLIMDPWQLEQSPLACPVLPWLMSLALGSSRTLFGLRRVTIVSSAFEGKNPVQRHRWAAAPCNLLAIALFRICWAAHGKGGGLIVEAPSRAPPFALLPPVPVRGAGQPAPLQPAPCASHVPIGAGWCTSCCKPRLMRGCTRWR